MLILTTDFTLYDQNKTIPPKSSLKRNFIISYDINMTNEFRNISGNSQTKKKNQRKRSREANGIVSTIPITEYVAEVPNISY